MPRLLRVATGALLALALIIAVPARMSGQTLTAQIQQFWNLLGTGSYAFQTLRLNANSYANWGTTLGTNGYGFRDNAGTIQVKNSGGAWAAFPAGGIAPADATYITQIPNATLTNEQALSALATGFVLNTTGTGVLSAWAGSGCSNSFISNIASNGVLTCNSQPGTPGIADWGASGFGWKDIYFSGGSGTPASNDFKLTGTSTTGHLTVTFPDNSGTVAELNVANLFTAAQSVNLTALTTTPTDGIVAANTTNATGGATVQMSPRLKFRGNAWDTAMTETVDFTVENLPVSAATPTGIFKVGYSLNGAAVTYPMTLTSAGNATFIGSVTASTSGFSAANGSNISFSGASRFSSATDKLMLVRDSGGTTGMEINGGTPTLGTCTGGTMVSGSHNFGGEVTGNTSGSCVINFGTPNFTNTPFCTLNDEASLTAIRVSARSNSSITVTGTPSGEAFQFICVGRVGT